MHGAWALNGAYTRRLIGFDESDLALGIVDRRGLRAHLARGRS